MSPFWAGSLASLVAGLATCLGALPILGLRRPTDAQQNMLLGFAAGVMLAASFFSLIIPGLTLAQDMGSTKLQAAGQICAAVLIGAAGLSGLGVAASRIERAGMRGRDPLDERSRRIWLLIAAITLHNFPEGMAVGVSFGGGDFAGGMATATGIGIQNIPEGLAVAGAAMSLGHSRAKAFLVALVSGLAEPIAGLAGAAAVAVAQSLLPWGLGAAAGAMIYIVAAEIIPDTHDRRGGKRSMAGLMVGLAAMMFLDVSLS